MMRLSEESILLLLLVSLFLLERMDSEYSELVSNSPVESVTWCLLPLGVLFPRLVPLGITLARDSCGFWVICGEFAETVFTLVEVVSGIGVGAGLAFVRVGGGGAARRGISAVVRLFDLCLET